MLPVLFSVGPLTVYTFGFLLAIGFFLSAFITWRRLREMGLDEEKIIDFIILAVITGIFLVWASSLIGKQKLCGLGTFAGLFGVFLVLAWFTKKERWNWWRVADELTFGILPLLFLIEIGTFLDGSCPGKATSMPWGVYFPGSLLRCQPVSVFSAVAFFLIWLILLKIERLWRLWRWYQSKNDGFIFLSFLTLSFLSNSAVAFWRSNEVYWGWVEIGVSLLGAVAGGVVFYIRSGRNLKKDLAIQAKNSRHDQEKS